MTNALTQNAARPVATLWTSRLIVLSTVSLLLNVVLGGLYYLQKQDTAVAHETTLSAVEERDLLMQLVPAVNPGVNPPALAAELRSRYPGEEVNVIGKQVQWRFFHFWFDEHGRLVEVKYYS